MKKTLLIAFIATVVTVLLGLLFPQTFQTIDARIIDNYFGIRGPIPTQEKIVLITIDEKSINALGRWPWPRTVFGKAVQELKKQGIQAIGFDVTFSEPSPQDAQFAKQLRSFPSAVLGYFFYAGGQEIVDAGLDYDELIENEKIISGSRLDVLRGPIRSGLSVAGVQSNVAKISNAVAENSHGFFNVFPDVDGVIRRLPLMLFYKDIPYPSLTLQIVGQEKGFTPIPLTDNAGILSGLAIADQKIPISPTGEFFVNYRGPGYTFPHISISDVVEGRVDPAQIEGKIAIIGATSAIGLSDIRTVPIDTHFPGPEIHANAIDNMIAGDFLITNSTTHFLSLGLILFAAIFLGTVPTKFRALNSLYIFLGFIIVLVGLGYFLFASKNLLLYNFKPILNALLVYGSITVYRYFTEERQRRKIKKAFQHYLSPILIKKLMAHPDQLKLGGERKTLTVLFSDIRNFTGNSERLPPERVVDLLNAYFNDMTEIIFKYGGTLDKYIGDAIMAIFGAPLSHTDHAVRACFAALEMIEVLKQHQDEWCQQFGFEKLNIGVGINTGPMAVGNMGSEKRFNYTVIGDSVNLSSRLESLNKEHNTEIIISDDTYQLVKNYVEAREIGKVKVKGKEKETLIYELIAKKVPVIIS